eukprot:1072281-Rhodomonas_salina.6
MLPGLRAGGGVPGVSRAVDPRRDCTAKSSATKHSQPKHKKNPDTKGHRPLCGGQESAVAASRRDAEAAGVVESPARTRVSSPGRAVPCLVLVPA